MYLIFIRIISLCVVTISFFFPHLPEGPECSVNDSPHDLGWLQVFALLTLILKLLMYRDHLQHIPELKMPPLTMFLYFFFIASCFFFTKCQVN